MSEWVAPVRSLLYLVCPIRGKGERGVRVRSQALPIGTRLERYVIKAVLGGGGFGITYLAEHEILKRPYAVKELFPAQFATRDSASGWVTYTDLPDHEWARK